MDCGSFFDQIDDLLQFPNEDDFDQYVNVFIANEAEAYDSFNFIDVQFPAPAAAGDDIFSSAHVSSSTPILSTSASAFALHNGGTGDNAVITTPTGSVDLAAGELPVPHEDIAQLEWLSAFVEDSFSGGCSMMGINETDNNSVSGGCSTMATNETDNNSFSGGCSTMAATNETDHNSFSGGCSTMAATNETDHNSSSLITMTKVNSQLRSASSPVSVLDSSTTSCSMTLSHHEKRARTKRPRPVTFNPPRAAMHLIISPPPPSSSIAENDNSLSLVLANSSSSESHPLKKLLLAKPAVRKDKSRTTKTDRNANANAGSQAAAAMSMGMSVRKCLHCEITKTPQWRAGPLGPKTLCNACGVRYKSGRLFPEYRPAASPTFVPSQHSNSHRKVLEMRTRRSTTATATAAAASSTTAFVKSHVGANKAKTVVSSLPELMSTTTTTTSCSLPELISTTTTTTSCCCLPELISTTTTSSLPELISTAAAAAAATTTSCGSLIPAFM